MLRNKIKSTIMATILIVNSVGMVYGSDLVSEKSNVSGSIVSIVEAQNVAEKHILSVMNSGVDSDWKEGVEIVEKRALFNELYEVSGYYFEIATLDGTPAGNIIINADKTKYPIVEYSYGGMSFLEEAIEDTEIMAENEKGSLVNAEYSKVLYLGNMTYCTEYTMEDGSKQTYDVSTSNYVNIDKAVNMSDLDCTKSDFWGNYTTGGSNPPNDGNDIITNPYDWESGYDDNNYYVIPGGNRSYYTMTAFSSGGVCAPTAATNLCYYWASVYPDEYSSLKLGSWKNTFNHFMNYMGTDLSDGTWDYNIWDAYEAVFEDADIGCTAVTHYGTNEGRLIVEELNKNRPCHLIMHNHETYGDHSVLAIGYADFTYDGWWNEPSSTYIRIADGHTSNSNRYVWGACYGTWNYVSVIPN